ncbi:MAG: hypothetical protein KF752_11110 [Pirellulaceae bacterium]|nr:hypothetical protein [Pirellulaceae bacterium]
MIALNSQCRLAIVALAIVVVNSQGASAQFTAGAAKKSIQPKLPVGVSGGMGAPRMAKEARGELTARAVAFANGETKVAMCCLDLLGFPSVLCERVRAKVQGVPKENIIVASTHTHSAPDAYAFPDGKGGHTGDLKYIDLVVDQAAAAIQDAVDSLQPAVLRSASGVAKGKIAYNYYAPDLYDRRMNILQAQTPDGTTIFTLVNYAIHPEVLGNEVGIVSPDAIGPLCDKLESDLGGLGVFFNGAQGGMVTADNRALDRPSDPQRAYWHDDRTWEECLRIGNLMASEAQRLLGDTPAQKNPAVVCQTRSVRFPVDSDLLWQVFVHSPLNHDPNRQDRSVNVPVSLINLGDTQIATIPGEALPNIGFYLKRKMNGQHQMLLGLANDAFGYILTKVDFGSFPRYDYVSRTSLGEMTGEILIENILEMVAQSPQPQK